MSLEGTWPGFGVGCLTRTSCGQRNKEGKIDEAVDVIFPVCSLSRFFFFPHHLPIFCHLLTMLLLPLGYWNWEYSNPLYKISWCSGLSISTGSTSTDSSTSPCIPEKFPSLLGCQRFCASALQEITVIYTAGTNVMAWSYSNKTRV